MRGYFDGPCGQIHYRLGREPGSPLVLLHQSPLSGTQFDVVLPGLVAAGYRPLALDMPGFGMSDAAADSATLQDFASVVPAAMDHLGWAEAPLVGHHTGAAVAALTACAHPRRVGALVLNGYPLLSAAEREHFAGFYFGPKQPREDGSHLLLAWQNRLRSTPGWSDISLMHRYTVEALHRDATNWRAFPLVLAADLEQVLRELRVPALLFTNTGEDLYESTRRAHALRPDLAYAELDGGTHDIIDEQPGEWTSVVVQFLRSAEG